MAGAQAKRLRGEIVALLCLKVAGLALIYWAFFGPAVQPHITTPDIAAHLLAPATEQRP